MSLRKLINKIEEYIFDAAHLLCVSVTKTVLPMVLLQPGQWLTSKYHGLMHSLFSFIDDLALKVNCVISAPLGTLNEVTKWNSPSTCIKSIKPMVTKLKYLWNRKTLAL